MVQCIHTHTHTHVHAYTFTHTPQTHTHTHTHTHAQAVLPSWSACLCLPGQLIACCLLVYSSITSSSCAALIFDGATNPVHPNTIGSIDPNCAVAEVVQGEQPMGAWLTRPGYQSESSIFPPNGDFSRRGRLTFQE